MIAARRLLVAGFALAFGLSQVQAQESASQPATAPLPLNELRTFAEVFERIRGSYVEPVDDATLLENAIRGMLEGLDPHSAYLTPEDYTGLQDSTEGQFGGLGIEVGQEDGFLKVVSPIDDTPAAEAGIEAGDLIIKIDDQPVKGMSLMDAVDSMRGEPGSEVRLTLVRGEGRPFEVTLTRAIIKVKSVKTEDLEPGYVYLRITPTASSRAWCSICATTRVAFCKRRSRWSTASSTAA